MPRMVAGRGPRTKWCWGRGKQPIKFRKGFHFVIGFKCTWLDLEKVVDFIIAELFKEAGCTFKEDVQQRFLHIELGYPTATRQMYHIIDGIKRDFPFTADTSVPGWWREESLYTTISYCALYLHSWLKSNQREQDKHSQAIKVGTDMYLDLFNFPCQPGAGPPPNEN